MGSGDRSTLVRICDPVGRPRGTGFVADDRGTVVTSHEAVDGLLRLVLHGTGDRSCRVEADAITTLPELGLALVRTGGLDVLGVEPLPIVLRDRIEAGTYVRIAAHGWREARVLGVAPVTYTATDRSYRVGAAMELALGTDGRDALRLRGAAVGGPVVDPDSGAVIAVVGTALRGGHTAAGFAVPLVGTETVEPLGELLRRNATTVPGYGRDLNLAGALQLAAMSIGAAGGPGAWPDPVERPDITAEFTAFTAAGERPAVVFGLVAEPGTGRTTELAALAARRARGCDPALTLWLRGADLLADDVSVADAISRALGEAGRIVTAAGAGGDMATATPERVARLAADSGRPLLVLLDAPAEMPPVLAHRLDRWTAGTADWLRSNRARLVVACRPEHWETAGALCPPGALHRPARPARRLPAAVRLADLTASQAEGARERYGIPADALAPGHDRHPLTLRLLAEVRAALPEDVAGQPDTDDVFGAHLDLMCLRIAVRIAAPSRPVLRGTAVRRLAARVTGQVHEAARRCLGPGPGGAGPRGVRGGLPPGARDGRRRSSPRACWSRRAGATASRTRSWGTGCRAAIWTWTHCSVQRRPDPPGVRRPVPGRWSTVPGCCSSAPPKGRPASTDGWSNWPVTCPDSPGWSPDGWPMRRRSGRPSSARCAADRGDPVHRDDDADAGPGPGAWQS